MRNYTGLAVWGCLAAMLALEFSDLGSPSKTRLQAAKSGIIQPVAVPAAAPVANPAGDGKTMAAKAVSSDKRKRESLHVPFAHIRDRRDGAMSYRQ